MNTSPFNLDRAPIYGAQPSRGPSPEQESEPRTIDDVDVDRIIDSVFWAASFDPKPEEDDGRWSLDEIVLFEHPKRTFAEPSSRPVHMTVIDDSEDLLAVMREFLEDEGYRVSTYSFPPPPDVLIGDRPDAILLDVMFHHSPIGLAYRESLRRCSPLRAVPIVLCTVARELVEAEFCPLSDPLTTILVKPFGIAELTSTVSSVAR